MSYRILVLLFLALVGLALAACAGTTPAGPAANLERFFVRRSVRR